MDPEGLTASLPLHSLLRDSQPVTIEHDEVMPAFSFPLATIHVHQSQDASFERIFELL